MCIRDISNSNSTSDADKSNKSSSSNSTPLSAKEVKKWVDGFNNYASANYGGTALESIGYNEYRRPNSGIVLDADYMIMQILNSSDLTQEQKDYLIYDKLNFTESQVNAVLNDNHYR